MGYVKGEAKRLPFDVAFPTGWDNLTRAFVDTRTSWLDSALVTGNIKPSLRIDDLGTNVAFEALSLR